MMLYPVNLRIDGKSCLVVGGGAVGLRKVRSLLASNARVSVVSPEVVDGIRVLAEQGRITLHLRRFRSGDLDGAFLVFAVTDNPQVQEAVAREAKERRVLLNIADNPGRCDFQVPAKVRRGELLLTVSTGGASPALAKLIRKRLEQKFGKEYESVLHLFARIREIVVDGSGNSAENRELFQRLLLADLVGLVRDGRWEKVATVLADELPSGVNIGKLIEELRQQ